MPNLDDEQFEAYLKKFRPVSPAPLPLDFRAKPTRHRSALGVCALAAVASVMLGVLLFHLHANRAGTGSFNRHVSPSESSPPLTLGAANHLLTNSLSLEAALDSLERGPVPVAIPPGKKSALAVLSQENLKP